MKTFNVRTAYPYLQQMKAAGLLTQVIPSIKNEGIFWDSLENFEKNPIPTALRAYRSEINEYLQEELGAEINKHSLIKLSLLLRGNLGGVGTPLRLSRKASLFMKCLFSGSKALKNSEQRLTQKEIIRFLRTYISDWRGVLLYTAASHPIDPVLFKRVANTYYEHIMPISKQGKLITGDDLIKKFGLKEGEQIGKLLKEIEALQFDGEIQTREEAFAAVAALIQGANRSL